MPELPEVETVRRGLEQKLKNFIIKRVEIRRESTVAYPICKKDFIEGLQNSLIYKWHRRGKYLIADLKRIERDNLNIKNDISLMSNGFLVVHLRMTGYFTFNNNLTSPCKHTRIRLFDSKNKIVKANTFKKNETKDFINLNKKNYGPLIIQSNTFEKKNGRKTLNVLNQNNKKLILSISCKSKELDVRIPWRKWRGWEPAKEEFEKNLINDLC